MLTDNLQQAIDAVEIQDVYQRRCNAQCADDFEPKYETDYAKLAYQRMHVVTRSEVLKQESDGKILRVFILLGARWVEASDDSDGEAVAEPKARAFVEAEYIAEYRLKSELSRECIDEFSLKNASYHVWPYWREFLSSQSARMHLPRQIEPAVQLAQNRLESAGTLCDGSESGSE